MSMSICNLIILTNLKYILYKYIIYNIFKSCFLYDCKSNTYLLRKFWKSPGKEFTHYFHIQNRAILLDIQ